MLNRRRTRRYAPGLYSWIDESCWPGEVTSMSSRGARLVPARGEDHVLTHTIRMSCEAKVLYD